MRSHTRSARSPEPEGPPGVLRGTRRHTAREASRPDNRRPGDRKALGPGGPRWRHRLHRRRRPHQHRQPCRYHEPRRSRLPCHVRHPRWLRNLRRNSDGAGAAGMSCLPVSHRSGLGNSPDANDGTTELRTSPPAQRHCSPVPGPGWLRPAPRHPGVAPRRAASLCPAAALANSLENRLSYSPPGNRSRRRPGVRAARRSPAPRRV